MNPLNALFLAMALVPALASAAPEPTFGAIFRHKQQKFAEKEEAKGKDKKKNKGKDVIYIVRPNYEVHQSYHPITPSYGGHHDTGYGAPIHHDAGYGAPIHHDVGYGAPVHHPLPGYPIGASHVVTPYRRDDGVDVRVLTESYDEPEEGYGYYA